MTKKDYELIAGCIARTRMVNELEGNSVKRQVRQACLRLVTIDLTATLAEENPLFNKQKFIKACGLED